METLKSSIDSLYDILKDGTQENHQKIFKELITYIREVKSPYKEVIFNMLDKSKELVKAEKKDEKKDDGPTTDTKKESRRVHAWEEWMDSAILPLCDLRNGLKLGKITCDEAIRGLEAIQNDLSSVASDVAEDLISDLRYAVNACEEDNVERVIYNINNTLENMQADVSCHTTPIFHQTCPWL